MHEFGIAKSLAESVREEAEKNHATSVSEVYVDIGELSFVGVDQLKFAYQLIAKETKILEKSILLITEIPAEVLCENCGYEGPLKNLEEPETHFITPIFACPSCAGKIQILKGRECTIKNIKLMVDDDV